MLSISISQPVIWSPASTPAIAAVSSAVAVTPVQPGARDGQAGMGQSGRDAWSQDQAARAHAVQAERRAEADKSVPKGLEAAPLLPRPQSEDAPDQQAAEAQAQEEQKAKQAEEAASELQLKDVIVNVWRASAAVVEPVLGRDAGVSAVAADAEAVGPVAPGAKAATSVARTEAGVSESAPREVQNMGIESAEAREVVAYDAQGHSSLAPLETGVLISQHV